uniref:Uncharacterized protein n=3 Tax=Canis lupus TaxID=9612 RepID=A0A8C0MQD3_CANLF
MYRKLNSVHLAQFGGQFFSLCLFDLGNASHRLWTEDDASPVTADLLTSVVIGPDISHLLSQSSFVFRVNSCEGDSGPGLPMGQMRQPGPPLIM